MTQHGDPLADWTPGEDFHPRADTFNLIFRVVREVLRGAGITGSPKLQNRDENSITVIVKNMTAGALGQFSVVGIGAPLILPADSFPTFSFRRAHEGTTPAPFGAFAITQEPLGVVSPGAGASGRAIVLGVTPAYLDVVDESHQYAGPTNSTTLLRTQCDVGPARILWKEPLASGSASASASGSGGGRRAVVMLTGAGGQACTATSGSSSSSSSASGSGSGSRPRATFVTCVQLVSSSGSGAASGTGSAGGGVGGVGGGL